MEEQCARCQKWVKDEEIYVNIAHTDIYFCNLCILLDQPERSKRDDSFGSIFDVIPCYGSHGDANTPEGKFNRETCPDCQKRCGALNIVETQ